MHIIIHIPKEIKTCAVKTKNQKLDFFSSLKGGVAGLLCLIFLALIKATLIHDA